MIRALKPRRRWAALTAAAAIAAVLPLGAAHHAGAGRANTAGPPTDYRKVDGLSKPVYPKTVRDTFDVPMHDDINLYVEATYPDPK
ncbi:MAG: hypothetical protein ACRDJI_00795, partial [Actinomycetota bacterium]